MVLISYQTGPSWVSCALCGCTQGAVWTRAWGRSRTWGRWRSRCRCRYRPEEASGESTATDRETRDRHRTDTWQTRVLWDATRENVRRINLLASFLSDRLQTRTHTPTEQEKNLIKKKEDLQNLIGWPYRIKKGVAAYHVVGILSGVREEILFVFQSSLRLFVLLSFQLLPHLPSAFSGFDALLKQAHHKNYFSIKGFFFAL